MEVVTAFGRKSNHFLPELPEQEEALLGWRVSARLGVRPSVRLSADVSTIPIIHRTGSEKSERGGHFVRRPTPNGKITPPNEYRHRLARGGSSGTTEPRENVSANIFSYQNQLHFPLSLYFRHDARPRQLSAFT